MKRLSIGFALLVALGLALALVESMLQSARQQDAGFAAELERSNRDAEEAIDRMVEKHGHDAWV